MNARWYLPGIGRFASADTIVPDPANPQSYNRYSYVENRPLSFTDPSGHCAYDVSGNEDRANDGACWQAYDQAFSLLGSDFGFLAGWQIADLQSLLFWMSLGVSIQNQLGGLWTSSNLSTAISGLNYVQSAINDTGVLRRILGLSDGLTLIMCPDCNRANINHYYTRGVNSITFDDAGPITMVEFLHEIGHAVDWNVGSGGWFRRDWWSNEMLIGNGWQEVRRPCWFFFTCATGTLTQDLSYTPPYSNSFNHSPQEDFADTFAGYILDNVGQYPSGWNPMPQGRINALSVEFQP